MITKRMVGIALALFGMVATAGVMAVDIVGAGKWGGMGPAQSLAVRAAFGVFLIGLSLVPLGDRPA